MALVVDEGKLLDLVLGEDGERLVGVHADPPGDERHLGHDVADLGGGLLEVGDEAHVAVRDDADELAVAVDHGQAAHAVGRAQRIDIGDRRVGRRRHRIRDHARLAALDPVDHVGLVGDREVSMQDADAALTRHRDGHAGLGDRVHRGRQQRRRDPDAAGEL